jgi:hypothetical protein
LGILLPVHKQDTKDEKFTQKLTGRKWQKPDTVAHFCIPSSSGSGDQGGLQFEPNCGKKLISFIFGSLS